jgi:hypothetical protein
LPDYLPNIRLSFFTSAEFITTGSACKDDDSDESNFNIQLVGNKLKTE